MVYMCEMDAHKQDDDDEVMIMIILMLVRDAGGEDGGYDYWRLLGDCR